MPELSTLHCEGGRPQAVVLHAGLRLHSALGLPADQHPYLQGLRAPPAFRLPGYFGGCRSEKARTWGSPGASPEPLADPDSDRPPESSEGSKLRHPLRL